MGCEPQTLDDVLKGEIGLSEPVTAAVEEAVRVIEGVVADLLASPAGPAAAIRSDASRNLAGGTR